MRGYNRVLIVGNLTHDPEVRYTVNKKAYCRLGIAINSRWRNANGEYQDNTDFINAVAWNATAETCGKYLKKGSPILVEGRLKTNSYEAKDGSGKRSSTEIWVDNMIMLGSGRSDSDSGGYSSGRSFQPSQPASSSPYGIDPPDESEFGSISEHGFSTGYSQDFGSSSNDSAPDSLNDSEIPF